MGIYANSSFTRVVLNMNFVFVSHCPFLNKNYKSLDKFRSFQERHIVATSAYYSPMNNLL